MPLHRCGISHKPVVAGFCSYYGCRKETFGLFKNSCMPHSLELTLADFFFSGMKITLKK